MSDFQSVKDRLVIFIKSKNMPISKFEAVCGLSNGYVSNMRKAISTEKFSNIAKNFPELNRNWLLYGEGEMLRGVEAKQTTHGDNSPAVMGERNVVNNGCSADIIKLAEMHKEQIAKKDEQIDRLLSIIEKMQG